MKKTVSVIVPVYGVEKYLDQCIQSIVNQTYRDLEIILVDDGSPDACPQMCDAWAHRDSRIKVFHKENGGIASVRNFGLSVVTGEFIYFVDSDDFIVPDLLEKVMAVFGQYPVDIVTFNCEKIAEDGKPLGGTDTLENRVMSSYDAVQELVLGHIGDYVWNKVFRADVFHGVCFPGRGCFEDKAVMYQVFQNADRIYSLNEKLYFYLQRQGSIVHTLNVKSLGELYLAKIEQYNMLKDRYPQLEEQMLSQAALAAIRLYDRSLWEPGDPSVLRDAKDFLMEHRHEIMRDFPGINYRLYFCAPGLYAFLRKGKHQIGKWVRRIK